jgi:hypothetical protein
LPPRGKKLAPAIEGPRAGKILRNSSAATIGTGFECMPLQHGQPSRELARVEVPIVSSSPDVRKLLCKPRPKADGHLSPASIGGCANTFGLAHTRAKLPREAR